MTSSVAISSVPLSPFSITRVLAYLQSRAPAPLPGRPWPSPVHLRRLAAHVGRPAPALRTPRRHPPLAAHFVLLAAARFTSHAGPYLALRPPAAAWLALPWAEQVEQLRHAWQRAEDEDVFSAVGMAEALAIDFRHFVRQRLRATPKIPPYSLPCAGWLPAGADEACRLQFVGEAPPGLLFDLLQLGEETTPGSGLLELSSTTIRCALAHGYGERRLAHILEQATQQALPEQFTRLLNDCLQSTPRFYLETVHLLSVTQDEDIALLRAQRRLRCHVRRQISPRHAVVSAAMEPALREWLRSDSDGPGGAGLSPARPATAPDSGPEAANCWLGLRILQGLSELCPLPVTPPAAQIAALAASLPPAERADMARLYNEIMEQLHDLIRGRDAFFPALGQPSQALISRLQDAITAEARLPVLYRSPADAAPRYREISPLVLEQRGRLYYLEAYCYRAERYLTFRLDRLQLCDP